MCADTEVSVLKEDMSILTGPKKQMSLWSGPHRKLHSESGGRETKVKVGRTFIVVAMGKPTWYGWVGWRLASMNGYSLDIELFLGFWSRGD